MMIPFLYQVKLTCWTQDDEIPIEVGDILTQKGAAKEAGKQNVDVHEDVVMDENVGGKEKMDGDAVDDFNVEGNTQIVYEAIDDVQGVPNTGEGERGKGVATDEEYEDQIVESV